MLAAPALGCGGGGDDASDSPSARDAGTGSSTKPSVGGGKLDPGHVSIGRSGVGGAVAQGAACTPGSATSDPCPELTACMQSHCGGQLKRCYGQGLWSGDLTGGACSAFASCQRKCACTGEPGSLDQIQCFMDNNCLASLTSSCESCLESFSSCEESACKAEMQRCSATSASSPLSGDGGISWEGLLDGGLPNPGDAGTAPRDGGSSEAGSRDAGGAPSSDAGTPPRSDAGSVDPSTNVCSAARGDDDCTLCLKSKCCSTFSACVDNYDCSSLAVCVGDCTDDYCIDDCAAAYSDGIDTYNAYLDCADVSCAARCGG